MVTPSPAKPTTPFTATSASPDTSSNAAGPATNSVPAGSRSRMSSTRALSAIATTRGRNSITCCKSNSVLDRVPMTSIRNRSVLARTTSSVCVPIDPALPKSATLTRPSPLVFGSVDPENSSFDLPDTPATGCAEETSGSGAVVMTSPACHYVTDSWFIQFRYCCSQPADNRQTTGRASGTFRVTNGRLR